jgi:hypothetical protein
MAADTGPLGVQVALDIEPLDERSQVERGRRQDWNPARAARSPAFFSRSAKLTPGSSAIPAG